MRSILRRTAPFALSWALASCATSSAPDVHPVRPPPALCALAAGAPVLPDIAGFPQPATEPEKAAVTAFLVWLHEFGDWGNALKARADKTTAWCATP